MKYLVKFEGQLIDSRESDRTYTHAVIYVKADGTPGRAVAFCGRLDLAQKEVAKRDGVKFLAVPVEVDAAHEAAKKPKTHRIVWDNEGKTYLRGSYTSEKLAQKALARIAPIGYRIEAIPAVVS